MAAIKLREHIIWPAVAVIISHESIELNCNSKATLNTNVEWRRIYKCVWNTKTISQIKKTKLDKENASKWSLLLNDCFNLFCFFSLSSSSVSFFFKYNIYIIYSQTLGLMSLLISSYSLVLFLFLCLFVSLWSLTNLLIIGYLFRSLMTYHFISHLLSIASLFLCVIFITITLGSLAFFFVCSFIHIYIYIQLSFCYLN